MSLVIFLLKDKSSPVIQTVPLSASLSSNPSSNSLSTATNTPVTIPFLQSQLQQLNIQIKQLHGDITAIHDQEQDLVTQQIQNPSNH